MLTPLPFKQYHLARLLTGGLCKVYRAEPRAGHTGTLIVKMLRESWRGHPDAVERLYEEQRILALLDHPAFPALEHAGQIAGCAYFAYRYLHGRPLHDLLQRNAGPRMSWNAIHRLARSLFEALAALHDRMVPVVHADLSPEHVLIGPTGCAQIIDFGNAQRRSPQGPPSRYRPGRPYWLSPEQARGQPFDHRSDLYQAGALLADLVTGQTRFAAGTPEETRALAADPPVPDLSGAPAWLQPVLSRLLDRDPGRRYARAADVIEAIERHCMDGLEGGPQRAFTPLTAV